MSVPAPDDQSADRLPADRAAWCVQMARLITFLAATAFLVPMGAVMFFIAGTLNVPSIWLYLAIRVVFNAASTLHVP